MIIRERGTKLFGIKGPSGYHLGADEVTRVHASHTTLGVVKVISMKGCHSCCFSSSPSGKGIDGCLSCCFRSSPSGKGIEECLPCYFRSGKVIRIKGCLSCCFRSWHLIIITSMSMAMIFCTIQMFPINLSVLEHLNYVLLSAFNN